MSDLGQLPAWLGTAVVGAIIASLGYVAKLAIEQWRSIHAARATRLAALAEFSSLLRAGWVSFAIQNNHVKRLMQMLVNRGAIQEVSPYGYEQTITETFAKFTPEERELHGIIRGISIHSLRSINQALLEWVKKDATFKGAAHAPGLPGELARKLAHLEAHLLLWIGKYEGWIPEHPEHALVYTADEKEHGLEFPPGLDKLVDQALMKQSWFWG